MGPGWLSFKEAKPSAARVTHCAYEGSVPRPECVSFSQNNTRDPPPLSVLALRVTSAVDPVKGHQQIVCISALFHNNVNIDTPTEIDNTKDCVSVNTFVLPSLSPIDAGVADAAMKNYAPGLRVGLNERHMLSEFFEFIRKMDPDMIVGHGLTTTDLGVYICCQYHDSLGARACQFL